MNFLWAPKIYTSNGFVKENILEGKKTLDVGCGQRKLPGAVGLDINPDSQADIIHNIEKIPWPFEENFFDLIFIKHVLEHTNDVLAVLGEIHRITKPSGHLIIQVPYFRSVDAFTDLTHKHFFTSHSLDYVLEGFFLTNYQYVNFRFKKLAFWYGWPHPSKNPFRQLIKAFIHKHPDFYDKYLSLLLSVKCLTWELEVIKNENL